MKVGETITFTREVLGSAGYGVYPVYLENLALVSTTTDPLTPEYSGAPVTRHWTFLAIKSGWAKIQFVKLRPWEPSKAIWEEILPIYVKSTDNSGMTFETDPPVGAWSAFVKKPNNPESDLQNAIDALKGVGYDPLLVTTQTGSGGNYIFLANADASKSVPDSVFARVYKDEDKKARIANFTPLGNSSPGFAGGYAPFRDITGGEDSIFGEVFRDLSFEAEYVSMQVVASINYRFAGNVTLDTEAKVKCPVLLTVHMPPSGDPTVTGIEKVCNLV